MSDEITTPEALAQEIRRVDGAHSLGAGALAEALLPWINARPDRPSDLAALRDRLGHIVDRYGDAHDAQDCAVLHDLRALLDGAR